ncbi:HlyD family secretion protein [Chelatococcus asaccharovorans]|uniref:HlyD family secretion protein n=1 Tax=Chelatococcus asaccharovorans TaxID=28210 RepID=A0A2V3TY61_9HYPH|nr:HlyD family efflux transporter periplasmic adaptor subunit [Chelatococcus asaccharovorans]MBS7707468.1 HlyD family efflux transporter periplasmic adaptor subunit [Chelatococcus asaccharovorans]PXW54212.1 HlyD family secretion protein [Chelatococcus asaccharovorans]CAH1649883.1 putative membrane fusion protein YhiI [Chelatococcus asaccharovorans]CAH1691887.1 putative membrane fusion protein YhiI [Chelatococcus asaccharovorans]
MTWRKRPWLFAVLAVIILGAAYYGWHKLRGSDLPAGIASGNGRVEAVEIDISTKIPGRIREILADEGDFVAAGQVLARMDTEQLEAQRRQAEAQLRRAAVSIDTARSLVTQREAERAAAAAVVAQREAELDSADRKLARSEQLIKTNATSQQTLDDDRAAAQGARAAISAAKAQVAASEAAIGAAKAMVIDAEAAVDAAKAQIESITTDINDAVLKSPRDGRVQYRVAQPGEVLSAGGRVLNLVDLSEVYMTFFLPTAQAGRVAIGTDVRLVLDAAPQYVIPAKATFVSDVAQFTPKTVETEEERQKLMFRVKARIPPELLKKYIQYVKTGLPGMAYIRLDPDAVWPERLSGPLVQ